MSTPLHRAPPIVRSACYQVGSLCLVEASLLTAAAEDGGRRTRQIVRARQLAMWTTRQASSILGTRMSFPEIGEAFNRDHTTVIAACRSVQKRLDNGELEQESVTGVCAAVIAQVSATAESEKAALAPLSFSMVPVSDELIRRVERKLDNPTIFTSPAKVIEFVMADWLLRFKL